MTEPSRTVPDEPSLDDAPPTVATGSPPGPLTPAMAPAQTAASPATAPSADPADAPTTPTPAPGDPADAPTTPTPAPAPTMDAPDAPDTAPGEQDGATDAAPTDTTTGATPDAAAAPTTVDAPDDTAAPDDPADAPTVSVVRSPGGGLPPVPPDDPADAPTVSVVPPDLAPGVIYQADDATQPCPTAPWQRPRQWAWPVTCPGCGGVIDQDGYCTQCGARARNPRDHYTAAPADWVGGACDIGLQHAHNEDALAIQASANGQRAALVVCDGVTTSQDSDVASLAGAQAACASLWAADSQGLGLAESRSAALAHALREATRAADDAVIAATAPDSLNPASVTFAAALVADEAVYWANLGDSRVYWLPDDGEPAQLSVDHSLAQAQIDGGASREDAEASVLAHTITRWLGRDSVDSTPTTGELALDRPGWVLVCSDGLWNYASSADALASVLRGLLAAEPPTAVPVTVAQRLVDWANGQGGHDNITVALARCDGPPAATLGDD